MESLTMIAIALVSLGIGFFLASYFVKKALERKSNNLLEEAQEKAEILKKEKILQAKEKFLQLKAEHEKYVLEKNANLNKAENRIKQKETSFKSETRRCKSQKQGSFCHQG